MNLENFRKTQNLTYDELAEALGITKTTAYNICKGLSNTQLRTAKLIVEKTDGLVSYEDLMTKEATLN